MNTDRIAEMIEDVVNFKGVYIETESGFEEIKEWYYRGTKLNSSLLCSLIANMIKSKELVIEFAPNARKENKEYFNKLLKEKENV